MNTHFPDLKHIYVHIPFCQTRCAYCDFNTFAHRDEWMQGYVHALVVQLEQMSRGTWRPDPAWATAPRDVQPAPQHTLHDVAGPLRRADLPPTIFLGGGTPTALPLPLLEQIMTALAAIMPLATAEVTSEANPGTVLGPDYLRTMRTMGINRLSMGVQSLNDRTLRTLGRIHTAAEARASYDAARRVGFDNINLDFIFGLPHQDVAEWEDSLHELVRWDVDHFALYSLILEPGTPLAGQVAAGRVTVPNDDATADMYERAIDILGTAGYLQYEISNWAKPQPAATPPDSATTLPAYASRHNVAYWLNADYLGCGAGAHAHSRRWRWHDELTLERFVAQVQAGEPPIAQATPLDQHDVEAETMMMGLRLSTGVGETHFAERCGRSLDAAYSHELADLIELGLLQRDEHGVRLTQRGRMLGNQVFARFV